MRHISNKPEPKFKIVCFMMDIERKKIWRNKWIRTYCPIPFSVQTYKYDDVGQRFQWQALNGEAAAIEYFHTKKTGFYEFLQFILLTLIY